MRHISIGITIVLILMFQVSKAHDCYNKFTGQLSNEQEGRHIVTGKLLQPVNYDVLSIGNNYPKIFSGKIYYEITRPSTSTPLIHHYCLGNIADIDNNGENDLVLLDEKDNTLFLYKGETLLTAQPTPIDLVAPNYTGSSLCCGDFNNDGYADILVGQNSSDRVGRAIICFGKPDYKTIGQNWASEGYDGYFGFSCCTAGDLNKDGYADFAIGAFTAGEDKQGKVYIFAGGAQVSNQPRLILSGQQPGGSFGYSLAAIGDLNKDGYDDLLVGAPTSGTERAGQAFVFFGGAAMDTTADIVINGEKTDDFFGGALASRHRQDKRGSSDFIVSAVNNDENGESSGKVYAFAGQMPFSSAPIDTWTGAQPEEYFGYSLAAGWGVAQDNTWGWVIGAPYNDEQAENGGKIYIYPAVTALASISGKVLYRDSNLAVPKATLQISGVNKTSSADSSGQFLFSGLSRGTSYVVAPSIPVTLDLAGNAVMMYDAALCAQGAIGLRSLVSYEKISADANQDGVISMFDAALIAQSAISLPKRSESRVKDWLFDPATKSYSSLTENKTGQNFKAILIGDVNGDWRPTLALEKVSAREFAENINAELDTQGHLVLSVNKITINDLLAADLTIKYDDTQLKLLEYKAAHLTEQFHSVANSDQGRVRLGLYSASPAKGNGQVASFVFDRLEPNSAQTEIAVESYIENDESAISLVRTIDFGHLLALPKSLELQQNYPNPFNGTTTIRVALPAAAEVSIRIYNVLGKLVKTLIDDQRLAAGYHNLSWNGCDEFGMTGSSGLYFCELIAGNGRKIIKMAYAK